MSALTTAARHKPSGRRPAAAWACGPKSTSTPLVPDPGKTISEGAVLPWNSGGRRLSMYAAGELGVRLDVCHGTRLRPEALTSEQPTICCAAARIASAAARIPGGAYFQGDSRYPARQLVE
jgi:hypothetical protein